MSIIKQTFFGVDGGQCKLCGEPHGAHQGQHQECPDLSFEYSSEVTGSGRAYEKQLQRARQLGITLKPTE